MSPSFVWKQAALGMSAWPTRNSEMSGRNADRHETKPDWKKMQRCMFLTVLNQSLASRQFLEQAAVSHKWECAALQVSKGTEQPHRKQHGKTCDPEKTTENNNNKKTFRLPYFPKLRARTDDGVVLDLHGKGPLTSAERAREGRRNQRDKSSPLFDALHPLS